MRMQRMVVVAIALLAATSLFGQNARSAVSATGVDTAACTVTDPCRTFAAAITHTINGGEIVVLSSAGYGPFVIDRSVAITCPAGVYAGITSTSGPAIAINGPGIGVILRNLTLNGTGGTIGVDFQAGWELFADALTIDKFTQYGMYLHAPNSHVVVNDTTVRRIGEDGIYIFGNYAFVLATIDDTHVEDSTGDGIVISTGTYLPTGISGGAAVVGIPPVTATITNTRATGSGLSGFRISNSATADIEHCAASFNAIAGVYAENYAHVRVSNSTFSANQWGLRSVNAGVVHTRTNNTVEGNTYDISGVPVPITAK